MNTSVLPISNIVNVTITNTPQGLSEKNVNSLALFTNEAPDNLDAFGIYISPAQVAEDYGTNSVTAQMANEVFAQTPNLRTGDGRLVILPMVSSNSGAATAVSATSGQFVTADLTSTLASIILVTNGDIKITVDSVAYNLTGLNFTECATLADVAAVLQARITDCIITGSATALTIKSKKVGTASTVALAAVSGGSGTDLSGNGYFKVSTGTATPGVNSSGETLSAAIARTSGQVGYAGVMSNLDLEDAAISAVAATVQARDLIFFQHCASTADIAGIGTTIKNATQTKTRILLYTPSQAAANLEKAAYAGRALSVNFEGSNTSQTMNLKSLANIVPDPGITQTLYSAAEIAGVDLYVSYDGVPSVFSTGGNDFFDNVYNDLALKFALETAGFNYLRQTNTKVPQTEQGMNGLKSAYGVVCERFVRNGSVAPGSWQSSETFGDPATFKQNVLDNGYYIYSLPIIRQNQAEREAREAPLVQIAIKRSGAIHTSDVIVLVND